MDEESQQDTLDAFEQAVAGPSEGAWRRIALGLMLLATAAVIGIAIATR